MADNYGQYGSIRVNSLLVDGAATITGALTQTGALTLAGALSIDDTTTSTSAITGSLHTDGGIGVAGTLYVGGATIFAAEVTRTGAISATNGRALKISTTQATPAMADGYGVIEKELTVTGTATGMINAESSWINLGGSAVVPGYSFVHNDGVHDGGATLTNAHISWAKYQCLLASNPAICTLWELNFSGANSEVNALFATNDITLALGYQAGTPTKAAVGSIPFHVDTNGAVLYIYLYDDPDAN